MPILGKLSSIPHGTYAGAQAHVKRKIPIDKKDSCGCRKARREYMNEWRKRNNAWKKRDKLNAKVRTRVGAWLIASHPDEARILAIKARREVIAEMKKEALKNT